MKPVLVVDDDRQIANLIRIRLEKKGYEAHCVFDGRSAITWALDHRPRLVLLDLRLPDCQGTQILEALLKNSPRTNVIMISAHADVTGAVECIKRGACDFIEKPFEFASFDAKVQQVMKQLELEAEVENLKRQVGEAVQFKSLVGTSSAMSRVSTAIELAARSEAAVLIQGESGTGKEVVARSIHHQSSTSGGAFIAVNCGAIPSELIESELFGHEKGAFTGAVSRTRGKFEQASGGTLFLDEVGELPLGMQVKLLRVLQEKEIERVGGQETVSVRVRVIAATNRNLRDMIGSGLFREDLYYRLNVLPIHLPPLRERREDIPKLFHHFLSRHFPENEGPPGVEESVMDRLRAMEWRGNVRELENFCERLRLILNGRREVCVKDLDDVEYLLRNASFVHEGNVPSGLGAVGKTERNLYVEALQICEGNVSRASRMLDVSRDTFYRKMKRYAIPRAE